MYTMFAAGDGAEVAKSAMETVIAAMTDVFTLNETAARLWQLMEGKDITPKELAVLLCNEYEVGEEDALKDVEKQLCEWKQSGLVG